MRYGVSPPSGGGMRASTSWFFTTHSFCSDSTSGIATRRGIGVTRFTQCDASRGVSTGSAAIAPLPQTRLDRVAVHHLAVAQHIGAADVDGAVHVGRHPRRAEQVVQHVAHRDRLDAVAHPLRRRHVRQHFGEVAHHLERRRARPDDDAGLQHERRHARCRAGSRPTSTRERRCGDSCDVFGVQAAEVHDAADGWPRPRPPRRSRPLPRSASLEALAGAHRVHEVVEHVDVPRPLAPTADGSVASPSTTSTLLPQSNAATRVRIAREHAHPVAGVEQARHEAPAEVAGAAEHEGERRGAVRARQGAQSRSRPVGAVRSSILARLRPARAGPTGRSPDEIASPKAWTPVVRRDRGEPDARVERERAGVVGGCRRGAVP